ncbi:MAG: hypothetical protein U1E38_10210 [Rhodospirillales bacterium]
MFTGSPPAAPVFRNGALAGYLFSTYAVTGSAGYSGKPLDVLAGIDLDARITGALLRHHNEPILVIGISPEALARYVAGFAGLDLRARIAGGAGERRPGLPDAIAGATVSSGVIRDALVRAGRAAARSRGLLGAPAQQARLDRESYEPASWRTAGRWLDPPAADPPRRGRGRPVRDRYDRQKADAPFVDLFAGLITPPRIGQNLLGKRAFDRLAARLGADEEAILVAANGLYSFKGTGYVRSGRFDRVQLVQGSKTFALTTAGYRTSSACWRRERRNSARSASSPSRAGRGSIRSLPGASTCWSATGRSRRSSPRLPAAVPLPASPRLPPLLWPRWRTMRARQMCRCGRKPGGSDGQASPPWRWFSPH